MKLMFYVDGTVPPSEKANCQLYFLLFFNMSILLLALYIHLITLFIHTNIQQITNKVYLEYIYTYILVVVINLINT